MNFNYNCKIYEQGFNIAVAFSAYDSEREPILDPSIGELYFAVAAWGIEIDENGEKIFYEKYERLETHRCTAE